MALKDTWKNKANGIDVADAQDINMVAQAIIDLEKNEGSKSPYIGENGNWYFWDNATQNYVDTGIKAEGIDGVGRTSEEVGAEIFNDYETNKAFSNYSHAEGYSTSAGMLGFYYYSIEFGEDSDTITLTDKQNELSDKDFSEVLAKYPEGAVISVVNNSKYVNCSKILSKNGNIITVEKLPFTSVGEIENPAMDDYSLWVETNPEIGVIPLGWYAHAEGENTNAGERASHSEGRDTFAYGQYGHAEGRNTKAGYNAHSEGRDTEAIAIISHAEGYKSIASGSYGSHAEGYSTCAAGKRGAHAEGAFTQANGEYSHAEGHYSQAIGEGAHAEGFVSQANGGYSHAEGICTVASSDGQHVEGKWNVEDTEGKYAHILGGGTSNEIRKNIHTIDWSGNAEFAGTVTSNGKLLATQEYVKDYIEGVISDIEEAILGGAW